VAGIATAWTVAVAGLGSAATELGPWYAALKQPPWKPPDPWFGPAWTLIFALSAWGCARAWLAAGQDGAQARAGRRALLWATAVNSVLNVAWSWIFFRLKRPDWALWEWLPFWLSIAVLAAFAWRLDRRAGLLLLPYLAWVAFAGGLNAAVVQLNGPFGAAAAGAAWGAPGTAALAAAACTDQFIVVQEKTPGST
jgi:translocator protein